MRITWTTAASLGFMLVAAGVATQVYNVGGEKANTLFYWLAALGLTGAAFYSFILEKVYQRNQAKEQGAAAAGGAGAAAAPAGAGGGGGEIDGLLKDAETKLAASKISQSGKLSELPVFFLLGDSGSTKTTVLMNSGMEPELLSGQVFQQDNMIAATRSANFWYAKKAVFVEAGGGLWSDVEGWKRMLKKLSPGKLKSVFGGGGSAPRAAIFFIDVERFLQAGAADTMVTVARSVQSRLNEISTQFGISFPVYVMFTKADRVTFFNDFVRNLSNEEATQVFGVTLPMRTNRGGVYGEEETQRLNNMFNELFYSLCDKRIEFLPRENDIEKAPGCYEFPREFRKLRATMVQFLVDLGRPSQLSTSPFLRGFYLTGVRPVLVNDVGATPIFQPKQSGFEGGGSATKMFRVGDIPQQQQVPMAAPQQSGGRKVPQWVFLSRLFNNVILEDKAAMGASEASTKTSGLQRFLLGGLAVLALIWSIGMTTSFFRNRALENEVIEAAQQLKNVRMAPNALPSEDDLKRLKGLRDKLALLSKWKKEGAPWSYRWGLYVGNDLYDPTRKAYYNGFQELLFRDTQTSRMLNWMQALPEKARPEDDYNYAYETLRAYLITTSEWKRVAPPAEQSRLKSTLSSRWSEKRENAIGDTRLKQADEEFVFYSGDLINGNPYSESASGPGVHQTRLHLASFSGFEQYYNRLVNEASAAKPAVNYNRMYSSTAEVVINNKDVPGAFTKAGWDWMRNRLANPDNLGGEEWVLGPPDKYPRANVNPRTLVQEIWRRYSDDYIARWRDYFKKNTIVLGYGGSASVAAAKLKVHSGSQAPILYLIGLATQNTAVEPATDAYAKKVRDAFLWAHNVVPAPGTQMIVGKNEPYVNALTALQAVMADYAATPADMGKMALANAKRTEGTATTQMVARAPNADLEAKLDQTILEIMLKPFNVDVSAAGPVNAAAGKFCSQFNVIKNKFPFNPAQKPEVSVDELNSLLAPNSGAFWQFYEQNLKTTLQRQGTNFVPVAGSGITYNDAFLRFIDQVARLSDAMYRGGNTPKLTYSIQLAAIDLLLDGRPAKSGSITIDGKAASLGGPASSFVWSGAPNHSVQFKNEDQTAFNEASLWAVFRFFVDTQVSGQGGNYSMVYTQRGGNQNREFAKARFQVDLGGAPAVFDKNFLNGLRCIAPAAR
ncbi:MAG TPA: ImcF-related family protein [Bryobacteraceae bacterium]|nr:ImcF-related family protein [Bryobacteraceae bacterium]